MCIFRIRIKFNLIYCSHVKYVSVYRNSVSVVYSLGNLIYESARCGDIVLLFFIDGQILIISELRAGFNRQFIRAFLVFMVTFWN